MKIRNLNSDIYHEILESPSAIFIVTEIFKMPLTDLIVVSKKMPVAFYRQVLIWCLWYEGVPTQAIVDTVQRDRTSIIHCVNNIDNYISVNDSRTLKIIQKIKTLKQKYNSR